jgi:heme/copper-type cytochrome/quinol oxidase subunit 3
LFTKNQSLSVFNWYCWSSRAFGDARDRVTKEKKKSQKPHSSTKKSHCKTEVFFMVPCYLFGSALTCHFVTSMQCAQQPRGSSLCGFHVAFHMLRQLDDIPDIKKAVVSR